MTDRVAELTAHAQALNPEERARLAQALLASLEPNVAGTDAAWDAELRRRIDEIASGAVTPIPAVDAFAQVRRALGR